MFSALWWLDSKVATRTTEKSKSGLRYTYIINSLQILTRMHFSRMRTDCYSGCQYQGVYDVTSCLILCSFWRVSVQRVCVQGSLSRGGVSVHHGRSLSRESLSKGSLSRGVSVQKGLCPGVHCPGVSVEWGKYITGTHLPFSMCSPSGRRCLARSREYSPSLSPSRVSFWGMEFINSYTPTGSEWSSAL